MSRIAKLKLHSVVRAVRKDGFEMGLFFLESVQKEPSAILITDDGKVFHCPLSLLGPASQDETVCYWKDRALAAEKMLSEKAQTCVSSSFGQEPLMRFD